ncbi:hypothetical protein [Microlunatus flavus]|uniref:Transcriptional regulator, AbiEi antitoxin, Type IV TA system n=1 Tax=Microlunatus flavus TaxID=1036181 RepID=A0A1H9MTE3_9ACTN|nr:hypothetical protein [Microlunatus flavus]SER26986.1 Transcriptional regulator, AbiEi antitoxin, Type IV TA system [Microlunatus flavus]
MDEVLLRSAATRGGLSDNDLARLVGLGDLERLRRGAYARALGARRSPEEVHRLLIGATVPQLGDGAVLSHASAGVLHGLPLWPAQVGTVHITRPRTGGGGRRTVVRRHTSALEAGETTTVDGWAVTTVPRTVVDLARTLPYEQGVAAGDAALRLGLDRGVLEAALRRQDRWPGAARARRVVLLADGRAESAGESLSRVLLTDQGLTPTELQLVVHGADGPLGRVDFAWPEHRTIGEFDGRVKYGRLLRPGEDVGDVVYREKLREDQLRDLGWQVVRWVWADLDRPAVIAERVRRAFARAHG